MSQRDIDSFIVDLMSSDHDGIFAFIGFNDDRMIDCWSPSHAARCVMQLRDWNSRVRVAEWALADVVARGATHCIADNQANLARAKAELARWEGQRDRLEARRKTDPIASKVSPFAA